VTSVAREAGVSAALIHNHYPSIAERIRQEQGRGSRAQRDAKHQELKVEREKAVIRRWLCSGAHRWFPECFLRVSRASNDRLKCHRKVAPEGPFAPEGPYTVTLWTTQFDPKRTFLRATNARQGLTGAAVKA
jgi:hypothetical protein